MTKKHISHLDYIPKIEPSSLIVVGEEGVDNLAKSDLEILTESFNIINTNEYQSIASDGTATSDDDGVLILSSIKDYDAITLGSKIIFGSESVYVEKKNTPDKVTTYPVAVQKSAIPFYYILSHLCNVEPNKNVSSYISSGFSKFICDFEVYNLYISSDVIVKEQMDIGGELNISSDSIFSEDLFVYGDINVSGQTIFEGTLPINLKELEITRLHSMDSGKMEATIGDATLNKLKISQGSLNVDIGSITSKERLTVGAFDTIDNMFITGDLDIPTIGRNLSVGANMAIEQNKIAVSNTSTTITDDLYSDSIVCDKITPEISSTENSLWTYSGQDRALNFKYKTLASGITRGLVQKPSIETCMATLNGIQTVSNNSVETVNFEVTDGKPGDWDVKNNFNNSEHRYYCNSGSKYKYFEPVNYVGIFLVTAIITIKGLLTLASRWDEGSAFYVFAGETLDDFTYYSRVKSHFIKVGSNKKVYDQITISFSMIDYYHRNEAISILVGNYSGRLKYIQKKNSFFSITRLA